MRAYIVATAVVLLGPLTPLVASESLATTRHPSTVIVYRGSDADHPSPIVVHRGSAAAPGYLSTSSSRAEPVSEPVGGRQIWFVDRANDRLTNCRAWNTTVIGQRRIVCTPTRRPPA
jgi:hypothetical protein